MSNPIKEVVKLGLESVRRHLSERRIKRGEECHTRAGLVRGLRDMGILPGDSLFVHSSLRSIGYVEGGAETVIQALQEAVGRNGTLVIPTYYMPGGTIHGTCELNDYVFDVQKHGTHMGRIPEVFLKTKGIFRSIHPTHSVSAWGRHARYLTESHHRAPSVFGEGSPWQRILEISDAKVLGLGISMGPVTFYHVLEDSLGEDFPLRIWQDRIYELPCVDECGAVCGVPVRPFDPSIAKRRIDHADREDLREFFLRDFQAEGLLTSGQVGSASAWSIRVDDFYKRLLSLAKSGITIYSTPEDLVGANQERLRRPAATPRTKAADSTFAV